MTLPIDQAKSILRQRLGVPAKDVAYVFGFRTPSGKALALHPRQKESRLWYQAPEVPDMPGIRQIASAKNDDLNGPMRPLAAPNTPRIELEDASALHRFLDWYLNESPSGQNNEVAAVPQASNFTAAYQRFCELVQAKSGHPFRGFDEGMVAAWENYKPRLREHALTLLAVSEWSEEQIGSGAILNRTIRAIEIQDSRLNLTNNLVFWQNRYGHANRDHRVLLEAVSKPAQRIEVENLLFGLFRGGADEGVIFDHMSDLTGGKYPLLAYLFFLKDIDRFMPIQPTGFDRAFRTIGVDFTTLRQCSWENYSEYNAMLDNLRTLIAQAADLKTVRLVDAHSFCWVFSTLIKQEAEGSLEPAPGDKDAGRVLGGREKSIIAMRMSVENTVRNANGQTVERIMKNKELRMSSTELERLIASLLDLQNDRCALTGIPLQYSGCVDDKNLRPSLDRKDSNGHYEADNLQVVCQFINFWKSDADNEEFKRLLMLVRGVEDLV